MPTRLLDLSDAVGAPAVRLQVTQALKPAPYATLSYCWGGDQPVKWRKSVLQDWTTAIPHGTLPKTIMDATTVCRRLRIRYLWIDSLCIIQDDDSPEKVREIAQMPQIYGNAEFTITAAGGKSVFDGFLNQRVATRYPDDVFKLPYRCASGSMGSVTLLRAITEPEPIDVRGWTLQERLLSPRTLEFGSRQLRWLCQEAKGRAQGFTDGWRVSPEDHEARKDTLGDDVFAHGSASSDINPVPPHGDVWDSLVSGWAHLVGVYSRRTLTVPADRILAISGIAQRYGRVLHDQYLVGLWRSSLPDALFWTTDPAGRATARPSPSTGPSWSWMSVAAPVAFGLTAAVPAPDVAANRTASFPAPDFQLLECDVRPADGNAYYGATARASPTVRARLLPAQFTADEERGAVLVFGMMNDAGGINSTEMICDALESDDERIKMREGGLMLLEMCSACSDTAWRSKGLVVRWIQGRKFARRGVFQSLTGRSACRVKDESVADWHQRRDREFNWFKYCVPRVIELV